MSSSVVLRPPLPQPQYSSSSRDVSLALVAANANGHLEAPLDATLAIIPVV